MEILVFFFFSSRRRHTRFSRDWSSDVCSSDLSTTDDTADAYEVRRMAGDLLDLEPVVRDALVLALPLSPVCRDDCQGLCPTCGSRWEDLPAGHTHETLDPRWAA